MTLQTKLNRDNLRRVQLLAASLPQDAQAQIFEELTFNITGGDNLFDLLKIIEADSAIDLMNYLAGDDLWTEDLLAYTEELYEEWHPSEEEEEVEEEFVLAA